MWKVHIIWWESINNVEIVANSGAVATFKITDAKRHVVAVTLLTEDNVKLIKQLNDRLKNLFIETNARWFLIKKEEPSNDNDTRHIRKLLESYYQGVKRLFVFASDDGNTNSEFKVDSYQKYYLPRVNTENVNIDCRNFCDKPIHNSIKKYDEVRKTAIEKGDDYTTGCLFNYAYFGKNYKLIVTGLNKQKALDAGPKTIQLFNYLLVK